MDVADQISGPKLRQIRKEQDITIAALARKMDIDASYLSMIERGERTLTDKLLARALHSLELPEDYFLAARLPTAAANVHQKFIDLFKKFNLPDIADAAKQLDEIERRLTKQDSASPSDQVSRLFLHALKKDQRNQQLISIRSARNAYTSLDHDIFNSYAPLCCQRNIPLWVLFRPSLGGAQEGGEFEDIEFQIRQRLPLLALNSDKCSFEAIPDFQSDFFSMDLHMAAPERAVICVGNKPRDVSSAIEIPLDHKGAKALIDYASMVRAYRDRKVLLFSYDKFMQFNEEYINLIYPKESFLLAQKFFGKCLRPANEYRDGTSWYQHYSKLKERGTIDVARLAEIRIQEARLSRQRANDPAVVMRQICSRSTIEKWAHGGDRTDKPMVDTSFEPKDDRLERIDYIRELLEKSESFELAAIEDEDGIELGWPSTGGERDLSWVVPNTHGIIFETTYSRPGTGAQFQELQCIVQSNSVSTQFTALFNRVWDRIQPRFKDKSAVRAWLLDVRHSVEDSNR